jgi:hypothetical protein
MGNTFINIVLSILETKNHLHDNNLISFVFIYHENNIK